MTTPNNAHGNSCGCGHNHDHAGANVTDKRVITPDYTGEGQVVDREPVAVTDPAAGTTEDRDLGLKDVHAAGEGCQCGHPENCTCGHHQTCDCAPGECKCAGGAGATDAAHHHGKDGACSCGCGHDASHQGKSEHPNNQGGVADHGDCECQQCQNARREGDDGNEGKDFTDPDTVNADGTNPAVTTVNKAETYNEGAGWNDGIAPQESANPESYENKNDTVN